MKQFERNNHSNHAIENNFKLLMEKKSLVSQVVAVDQDSRNKYWSNILQSLNKIREFQAGHF